jgi:hypothetical protein
MYSPPHQAHDLDFITFDGDDNCIAHVRELADVVCNIILLDRELERAY